MIECGDGLLPGATNAPLRRERLVRTCAPAGHRNTSPVGGLRWERQYRDRLKLRRPV